jgi:proteic killer suppression protein
MIRNFTDKETEKVWNGERSRKLPPDIQPKSRRLLFQLDSSDILADMRVPPGNRFEEFEGKPQRGI